ncbi:hypothetical protein [Pontibacter beigongshangensis]|uniref:hypothetical protein n=1 Tax=Pontibacter beigongshangensis TaxID=2574733 RepID=UPI0016508E25|nr:hypothetical protein [Pontibacter beigongshangensis]
MKIIILLVAILIMLAGIIKKTADDVQEIAIRTELKQYPNLLPTIEVVAKRLPRS